MNCLWVALTVLKLSYLPHRAWRYSSTLVKVKVVKTGVSHQILWLQMMQQELFYVEPLNDGSFSSSRILGGLTFGVWTKTRLCFRNSACEFLNGCLLRFYTFDSLMFLNFQMSSGFFVRDPPAEAVRFLTSCEPMWIPMSVKKERMNSED